MQNRREFVQGAAGLGIAALAARSRAAAKSAGRSFEYGSPLKEFDYSQISFGQCLQQTQLEKTQSLLMNLSEDSLLKPFRQNVGLSAPGCDLGGWYSSPEMGPWVFGQWVSALSRAFAIDKSAETQGKVGRLISGLSRTIEPGGKLFGESLLNDRDNSPAYHYDKLVCGLIDAHRFAGQKDALDILSRLTDAVTGHLPGKAVDFFTHWGAGESYTIPENQFIAWQRGADSRHLEMGIQYLQEDWFARLASGENALPGRHAYSHVNALCSAAKAYLVLGDYRYLQAARQGFGFVDAQSFATGGWGPNERFLPYRGVPDFDEFWGFMPLQTLGESVARTHYHFETCCGAYAHFKLTRYLLRITQDSTYGDSMERVMFNTVLGARDLLPDGRAFYKSDYNDYGRKVYFDGYGVIPSQWPCCSGTLTQVATDYRINTYLHDSDGVFVNLYIPSTLRWQQKAGPITLTQSGSYPLNDVITINIQSAQPQSFNLRLRIPGWAHNPSLRINGVSVKKTIQPGTFASIQREWRQGDKLELEFPRRLALKPVDSEHPDMVAVVNGPLVLFAVCQETPVATRQQLLDASRQNPESAEWIAHTAAGPLRLRPFWLVGDHRYSTYLRVT